MRNRIIAIAIAVLLLVVLLLRSCAPDQGGHGVTPAVKPVEKPLPPAPRFDADSAYAYVKKQVDFGPRVPGSAAHRACGDWMVAFLKQYADTVIEQTGTVTAFNGNKLPLRNIIASWNPENTQRVLLLTHWDTRPFADHDKVRQNEPIDGANDGGSGVGVLMEIARHAKSDPAQVGIDLFFTDVEDYGEPSGGMAKENSEDSWCLGAQYWAKNPHVPNYTARFGILLDMCGAKDARFWKEAYSMEYAGPVVNKVWKTAASIGVGDRFVDDVKYFVGVDDHVWVQRGRGIPTIDIIEYYPSTQSFNPSWHTHNDNMDVIDAQTLGAVGRTLTEVVWRER